MQGLLIREPYASLIADGHKTWEMRGSSFKKTGRFAIIPTSSGLVIGVATIARALKPLSSVEEFAATQLNHRIPECDFKLAIRRNWTTPLLITDAVRLKTHVKSKHKKGAVTWANLGLDVVYEIQDQLAQMTLCRKPG